MRFLTIALLFLSATVLAQPALRTALARLSRFSAWDVATTIGT